jgi:hypothetical protein
VKKSLDLRHYLRVAMADHRRALKPQPGERRRWKERGKNKVPREWQLCRFCEKAAEDPQHAAGTHLQLRGEFLKTLYNEVPSIRGQLTDPTSSFRSVLARREITPLLAMLAFNVLKIYDATPMLFGRTPNDSPSIIFGGLLSMHSAKGRPATIVLVLVESGDFYLGGESSNRVPQGFNRMYRHSTAGQSAAARVLQYLPPWNEYVFRWHLVVLL